MSSIRKKENRTKRQSFHGQSMRFDGSPNILSILNARQPNPLDDDERNTTTKNHQQESQNNENDVFKSTNYTAADGTQDGIDEKRQIFSSWQNDLPTSAREPLEDVEENEHSNVDCHRQLELHVQNPQLQPTVYQSTDNDDLIGSINLNDDVDETAVNSQPLLSSLQIVFRDGLRYMLSWNRLLSFLALYGRQRFSAELYHIMASAISSITDYSCHLPTYKTVKGKQHEYFINNCLPKNYIVHLDEKDHPPTIRESSVTIQTSDNQLKNVRECIRIVYASDWAKFDISMSHVYKQLYDKSTCTGDIDYNIEDSLLIRSRKTSIGSHLSFWACDGGSIVHCPVGTSIEIPCVNPAGTSTTPSPWKIRDELDTNNNVIKRYLKAVLGPQWCVGAQDTVPFHSDLTESADLTITERRVYNQLKSSPFPINNVISSIINEQETAVNTMETNSISRSNINRTGIGKKRMINNKRLRGMSSRRERILRKTFSSSKSDCIQQPMQERSVQKIFVFPSDICTILRPVGMPEQSDIVCLLVSSILSAATGSKAERIIWIRVPSSEGSSSCSFVDNNGKVLTCMVLQVVDIPVVLDMVVDNSESYAPPAGTLSDGTKYLIYRAAFYADEFKEKRSLSNVKNVCGCYLRPLGYKNRINNSSTAVHVLTLTPYGQNSNSALHLIIEDIVKGTIIGFDAIDPAGQRVKVFLDVPIFMGDYVKMSAVNDSMGHSANCFCGYCSLKRDSSGSGTTYIYTTSIHSRRLGFMRCDQKYNLIRKLQLDTAVKKNLGFKCSSNEEASNLPMVALSIKLNKDAPNVKLSAAGVPVIQPYFDSYMSVAVAPDHLLSGLTSDVLKCCFSAVPSQRERLDLEDKILSAAATNGLHTEGKFLMHKDGHYKGNKNMSMSTLFILLMVSIPYFNKLSTEYTRSTNPFNMPAKLHNYIACFYYWPSKTYDSNEDIELVHGNNRKYYYSTLLRFAKDYTTCVNQYLNSCNTQVNFKPDKPNGHRLIELTVHTLPLFGHGLLFSEMIFEMVHFFFKKWLEDNTHPDSHMTAVEIALVQAWSMNLYMALNIWKMETGDERLKAERTLRRLFFGEQSLQLEDQHPLLMGLQSTIHQRLQELFRNPLPRMMKGSTNTVFSTEHYEWRHQAARISTECDHVKNTALSCLSIALQLDVDLMFDSCVFYKSASLYTIEKYSKKPISYPYRTISKGTAVSLLVPSDNLNDKVINVISDPAGVRIYIGVVYIFTYRGELYVAGILLTHINGIVSAIGEDIRVLKLNNTVTRIALIHDCTSSCKVQNGTMVHSGSILSGENYSVVLRSSGYPPHTG